MYRYILYTIILFALEIPVYAEDPSSASQPSSESQVLSNLESEMGIIGKQALVIDIDTRVIEINARNIDASGKIINGGQQVVIWHETHRRVAIQGNPVSLKLVGSNLVIAVQFTPFIRRRGNVLAAQGQIWVVDPEKGMSYYTSIQTIPMVFGEPIYFFPLGPSKQLDSYIEMMLTVNQYNENNSTESNANHDSNKQN